MVLESVERLGLSDNCGAGLRYEEAEPASSKGRLQRGILGVQHVKRKISSRRATVNRRVRGFQFMA
jgi:hypothetical protein